MKNSPIKLLCLEFVVLVTLMVLIAVFIHIDTAILNNRLSELSFTEFSQSGFILLASISFFMKIKKEPESAGLFILISALFTMIFIREADYYLDFIYHGFWKVPVLLVFCSSIFYAYKNKNTIIAPLNHYQNTKAFTYTFIGFMITIVFSRVFGTGRLWEDIAATADSGYIKNVVQEGLELFGYALVLLGSLIVHLKHNKISTER